MLDLVLVSQEHCRPHLLVENSLADRTRLAQAMISKALLNERPIGISKKNNHENDHMLHCDNNSSFSISACKNDTRRLRDNYQSDDTV